MSKVFSVDAETLGLYGDAFCIGAVVYENGKEVDRWVGRYELSVYDQVPKWVEENVLPQIQHIPEKYITSYDMLEAFTEFWLKHRALVIAHIPYPVETSLFYDLWRYDFIKEDEGPYPLIDVGSMLHLEGYDATSVDKYLKMRGIQIEGNPHDPIYDSQAAAAVYHDLMGI